VPLSGIYTRPGQVMKMGAEMGIEHINAQAASSRSAAPR
jgi:branched-chain amino acid transport system substrate-binding protein